MTKLTIPNDDHRYLIELFRMDQAKKDDFLNKIKTDNDIEDIAELFHKTTNLNRDTTDEIIRVLFDIYELFDESKPDINDLASELLNELLNALQLSNLHLKEESLSSFKNYFINLLPLLGKFVIKAKILRLLPQHQHLFIKSGLYSDIRPAFMHGEINTPSTAIIVHSLKITYQESTEIKNIYLGLSGDDLEQLQYTIKRAIEKHKCLESMISCCGMKYLRMEKD